MRRIRSVRRTLVVLGMVAALVAALGVRRYADAEYTFALRLGLFPPVSATAPVSAGAWLDLFESSPLVGFIFARSGDVIHAVLVVLMIFGIRSSTLQRITRATSAAETVEDPDESVAVDPRVRLLDWSAGLGITAVFAYGAADIGLGWWAASRSPETAWYPPVAPGPGFLVALIVFSAAGALAAMAQTKDESLSPWIGRTGFLAQGFALGVILVPALWPIASGVMVAWCLACAWSLRRFP